MTTDADKGYEELSRIAHDWRARIDNEDATEADHEALKDWLAKDIRHEQAFDRAQTVWAALDHLRRTDIDDDLMPDRGKPVDRLLRETRLWVSATRIKAAAIVVSIAATAALITFSVRSVGRVQPSSESPTVASYETGIAETKTFVLADGTRVTLGARTRIEASVSEHTRTVNLQSGAAYFDVKPDASRPFSVEAGQLTATALGTQFDVRSNGGVFRVGVAEGRVEVGYPYVIDSVPTRLRTRLTLGPGEQVAATREAGLRPTRRISEDEAAAWRDHRLTYDGGTLEELVADANRYSKRRIVLTESAQVFLGRTITASFDANNIDRMLAMVALSYPIEIDATEPGVVRLRGKIDTDR
ncbi:MAG: FecR domain-containing protein [Myxococcota bacterium]